MLSTRHHKSSLSHLICMFKILLTLRASWETELTLRASKVSYHKDEWFS